MSTVPHGIPTTRQGASLRHVWTYADPTGEPLGHAARYDHADGSKDAVIPFFLRDGDRWKAGADPERRPLYGLDTLPEYPDTLVHIVEGEKCAAALHALGVIAVTSPGGANAPHMADWTPLARYWRIVILPDNDQPGEGYADAVVGILAALPGSREVKVARLPELPEGGDVVDWIAGRVEAWDGFGPLPDPEAVLGLRDELSEAIEEHAVTVTASRVEVQPVPLVPERVKPEVYPLDDLGPVLGDCAKLLAEAVQVPDALCGQSVLAAASLAAQAHGDVRTPDGRHLPLSLFCLSVAESGDRKSAVDRLALRPHDQHGERLREDYREKMREYKVRSAAYKKAVDYAKKSSVKGGVDAIAAALKALGDAPMPPPMPIIIIGDFTVEGIRRALAEGLPTIGLFTDEGGRMVGGHAMLPENALKTLTTLSGLWDGRASTTARGGDGIVSLHGKRAALHLMIQPVVAPMLFDDAQVAGQGFLWRCLPVWPESLAGTRMYRDTDVSATPEYRRYLDVIRWLLDTDLPLKQGSDRELDPPVLEMTPDAKEEWIGYHDDIEREQAEGMPLEHLRGFASKAAEHVLRVAGVIAMVDAAEGNATIGKMDASHIRRGIGIVQYHVGEMQRIRERGAVDTEAEKADRLLRWMREHPAESYTLRDLCQRGPGPLRNADTLRGLLAMLERNGHVARVGNGEVWRLSA